MKELQSSQALSEMQSQIFELKSSILVAFERTGTEPYNTDNMIKDILTEFPNLSEDDFTKAIRNGS